MRLISRFVVRHLSLSLFSCFSQKQGVLPLWFSDKGDYNRIGSGDLVETIGLAELLAGTGTDIRLRITKKNGDSFLIETSHTMSPDQLKWLEAGSALNYIKAVRKNG
jgi:homoaconitase